MHVKYTYDKTVNDQIYSFCDLSFWYDVKRSCNHESIDEWQGIEAGGSKNGKIQRDALAEKHLNRVKYNTKWPNLKKTELEEVSRWRLHFGRELASDVT